jgi:hypothetical protein
MKIEDSHIGEPCTKAWDELRGDGTTRSCDDCSKEVHDVSQLTRAHANELLADKQDVCLRYTQRADGTLVLADGLVRGRGMKARRLALAAALVAGTAYVTLPPRDAAHSRDDDHKYSMGGAVRATPPGADLPAIDDVGSAASAGAAAPDNAPPKSSADPK